MNGKKGFLAALFDLSFSEFITTRVLKVLYIVGIVLGGLWVLGMLATVFAKSVPLGVCFLIISPLIFLLIVIGMRIYVELIFVLFRIADDVRKVAQGGKTEGEEAEANNP